MGVDSVKKMNLKPRVSQNKKRASITDSGSYSFIWVYKNKRSFKIIEFYQ